jgi:hypothetical protein
LRPYKRTLPSNQQLSYAGVAKTDTIDLPRDYILQRILIDIRGDIDLSSASVVEDLGQRLISLIEIQLTGNYAGNKTVVSVSGVDLYFINFYDYGAGLERVVPSANGTDSPVSFQLCIDFRLAKNDPDDWSVGIPLYDTSSAVLKVEWVVLTTGYASSGGSNCALTGKITLFEGIPETTDEYNAAKKNPLYTLTAKEFTCDTNTTSGEERNTDIETGHLLRRLFMIVRTSGNARSDTEIDRLTLKKIDTSYFEETDWDAFGLEDESDYSLANYDGNRHIKGMIVHDFARGAFDERGRVFGESLIGLKSGDMKLKIWKNNASSKLRYIQEAIVAR